MAGSKVDCRLYGILYSHSALPQRLRYNNLYLRKIILVSGPDFPKLQPFKP